MANTKITAFLTSILCVFSLEAHPLEKLGKSIWAVGVGIGSVVGASRLQTGEYRLPVLPDPVFPVKTVITPSPVLKENQKKSLRNTRFSVSQELCTQDEMSNQMPRFGEYKSDR